MSISQLILLFSCLPSPDDYADEEDVQSFGYKRFGKWLLDFQLWPPLLVRIPSKSSAMSVQIISHQEHQTLVGSLPAAVFFWGYTEAHTSFPRSNLIFGWSLHSFFFSLVLTKAVWYSRNTNHSLPLLLHILTDSIGWTNDSLWADVGTLQLCEAYWWMLTFL